MAVFDALLRELFGGMVEERAWKYVGRVGVIRQHGGRVGSGYTRAGGSYPGSTRHPGISHGSLSLARGRDQTRNSSFAARVAHSAFLAAVAHRRGAADAKVRYKR